MKVALLTEIPAPYRVPLFNALAAELDVDLEVLFLRDRDPRRTSYRFDAEAASFSWRTLSGGELMRGSRWFVLNAPVTSSLLALRPDVVVIGGWSQPAFWEALLFAKLARRPVLAWVESTGRDERSDTWALELAKRRFIRACAGVLVPGRASAEYVLSLGVRRNRIGIAPNAVDPTLFGERVSVAARDREALRRRLDISQTCVLYVGRLEKEKGVDVALEALARLPAGVELALAGTGTEADALQVLAREIAPGRVRFLGFLQPEALVEWYAAADIFVLPSRSEQWGIPLNEAALAGLPLVATEAAGASYELIEDGSNGYRVPVEDAAALATAIGVLAGNPDLRRSAGRRSRELGEALTPQRWARAVIDLARNHGD